MRSRYFFRWDWLTQPDCLDCEGFFFLGGGEGFFFLGGGEGFFLAGAGFFLAGAGFFLGGDGVCLGGVICGRFRHPSLVTQ